MISNIRRPASIAVPAPSGKHGEPRVRVRPLQADGVSGAGSGRNRRPHARDDAVALHESVQRGGADMQHQKRYQDEGCQAADAPTKKALLGKAATVICSRRQGKEGLKITASQSSGMT